MAALVEKISGMSLTDFVRSKGLSDLGFSYEAYCIPDGCGVSQGGSGLMARPLDIMVLASLVMNYGEVNDRCMVSSEYLKDATSYKVPNFAKGSFLAEMQGERPPVLADRVRRVYDVRNGRAACTVLPGKGFDFGNNGGHNRQERRSAADY